MSVQHGNETEPLNQRLVLTGVSIVDPKEGSVKRQQTVWIESGKIQRLTSSEEANDVRDYAVVEARGKFVVPGFLDMHMHCLQDPQPENGLSLMLSYGVTGVRQMAGTSDLLERRREGKLHYGAETPALLAMPGEILTSANAATPSNAITEVRKQKAAGADFIKSIFIKPKVFAASLAEANRLGLPYGGHISPGVDMVKSSKAGLQFVEHLGPIDSLLLNTSKFKFFLLLLLRLRPPAAMNLSMEGMGEAERFIIANPMLFRLTMDPKALEKTQRLINSFSEDKSRRLAETFARNGTWMCPTLIRNRTMQFGDQPEFTDSPNLQYISSENRKLWSDAAQGYRTRLTPAFRDTLRQLEELSWRITRTHADAGVKMMAGTDSGGSGCWLVPGVSLHQEFDLLESVGLSPLQVLQMATCNGAEFLNKQDTLGSVSEGKTADLVLLDANPLESVQHLHSLWGVVRDDRFYSHQHMLDIRQRVAQRVAAA